MPKRERAPLVTEVTVTDQKNRKRLIKGLVQVRLGFGKSAFFDTHSHDARYPLDIIATALVQAEKRAIEIGLHLDLSSEEIKLRDEIFKALSWFFPAFLLLLDIYDF